MTPERVIIENLFSIVDKDGGDVPFKLNSAQAAIDDSFSGRDIIPKARQEGVSSYFLARGTAKCLSTRNTRAVVISHDTESTQRMLAKVHYFLENIRGPKAVIKTFSKNEVSFPKTNSVIYIGTAGSRKFGRGDTITNLHCSEVAFWSDPKTLLTGLFQAVPKSGEISLESTGNGVGNYYHRACMRASTGNSQYRMHFLPWHTFEEYRLELSDDIAQAILENLNDEWEEPQLVADYGLTAGQLAWRRMKLEELDYDMKNFKQEYPITLDECFQATGQSIFTIGNYSNRPDQWIKTDPNTYELVGHPISDHIYSVGADVAAGVERDYSVVEVVDLTDMEQVAEWRSNKIGPDIFGHKIAYLGRRYNEALLAVESNNHGIVTINELLKGNNGRPIYPTGKIVRGLRTDTLMDYGLRTTAQTKPLMIGKLRKLLLKLLKIHSPALHSELSTFVETENGSLEAQEGCFDDCVMALAEAMFIMEKALMAGAHSDSIYIENEPDPFSMDSIIKELRMRHQMYPISANTWPMDG